MDETKAMNDESEILRWGGLAGVAGGLLLILVFVIVGVFVPAYAAEPAAAVKWFPDIRTVRIIENALYLAVLILWVASFLAVYRAARTSQARGLIGSVMGIAGLVVLAVGALPHVAIVPLSDLYHAPGATPEDQATIALVWQASQGMLDAGLLAGLALLSVGLVVLGAAMVGAPAFGRRLGGFTVGLGAIGVVAAAVAMVDPGSPSPALGMLALIAFHLVLGWKTWSLSRVDWRLQERSAGESPVGAPRVALETVR